jgi:hypothetical protein
MAGAVTAASGQGVELPGPPLRPETLGGIQAGRTRHSAPPTLGQHDEDILRWLEEEDAR